MGTRGNETYTKIKKASRPSSTSFPGMLTLLIYISFSEKGPVAPFSNTHTHTHTHTQLVEQWSRNPVTRVRHQVDALVSFGKALILITRYLGEDLNPSVVWLLTLIQAFMLS